MSIRASVAMAVYNGEKYIKAQIDSILLMMSNDDELVISYETSTDKTLEIVKEYERRDSRVKLVIDKGHSVESNFNNAVKYCKGKYIFLADQDDLWINDKINKMIKFIESGTDIVVLIGDGYICDENLNIIEKISDKYKTNTSAIRNFIKGSYLGCQMMFISEVKEKIFPVKTNPPLPHDLWLGVLGKKYGKVAFINEVFILHRLHENNYSNTSKMNLISVIKNRLYFGKELFKRIKVNNNYETNSTKQR